MFFPPLHLIRADGLFFLSGENRYLHLQPFFSVEIRAIAQKGIPPQMGFLKFLLYFILAIVLLRVLWRLFGPAILRYFLKRFAKRVERKMREQQNAYQQKYDPNYKQEIRVSEEMTVKVPKQRKGQSRKERRYQNAEAVEYEEIDKHSKAGEA